MFAILKIGGKQYKVSKNSLIRTEKIVGQKGDKVKLDKVLMIQSDSGSLKIGAPLVKDAVVSAQIERQFKSDKVIVFKKKRRKNYRRKAGHRQNVTELRIIG